MQKLNMVVSKKVDGKFAEVGKLVFFAPALADFGIEAPVTGADDEGVPTYATDALNWLQRSILAATKAQIRNKLVSGTADLKDGQTIPETLADLCAESEGGSGAALEAIRAIKALWAKWVAASGKSAAAQTMLVTFFGNKQALATQSEATKGKVVGYIADFCGTLTEEQLTAGQRYIDSILGVASSVVEAEDF